PSPRDTSPLSLHDALPILRRRGPTPRSSLAPRRIGSRYAGRRTSCAASHVLPPKPELLAWSDSREERHGEVSAVLDITLRRRDPDRKSTRLNSSHQIISYA